jgi:ankyrin repeat protein
VASKAGLLSLVDILIREGADVNAVSGKEGSALQIAVVEGHLNIVRLLLAKGANIEGNWSNNIEAFPNPLCAAAVYGHNQIASALLGYGADLNAKGSDTSRPWYGSPLYHAWQHRHHNLVTILLQRGANFTSRMTLEQAIEYNFLTFDIKTGMYKVNGSVDWVNEGRSPPPRSPTPSLGARERSPSTHSRTASTSSFGTLNRSFHRIDDGSYVLFAPIPKPMY